MLYWPFPIIDFLLHRLGLFLLTPILFKLLSLIVACYKVTMPKKTTTAAEYLARRRTKSSGTDNDIANGEEVKGELALATQRYYGLALRL